MSYIQFNLDRACRALSLTLVENDDLFGRVPEVPVSDRLRSSLDENVPLAIDVNTEKMRSEFIIAPILMELRRLAAGRISLFSGIEFNVSEAEGLNGVCDFILSRSPLHLILRAPVLTIVEAKKEDIKAGLGQCAAEMVAARIFNEREGEDATTIYGAVTTGTLWRFLKLESSRLLVDRREHPLEPVGRILGILLHCVGGDPFDGGRGGLGEESDERHRTGQRLQRAMDDTRAVVARLRARRRRGTIVQNNPERWVVPTRSDSLYHPDLPDEVARSRKAINDPDSTEGDV